MASQIGAFRWHNDSPPKNNNYEPPAPVDKLTLQQRVQGVENEPIIHQDIGSDFMDLVYTFINILDRYQYNIPYSMLEMVQRYRQFNNGQSPPNELYGGIKLYREIVTYNELVLDAYNIGTQRKSLEDRKTIARIISGKPDLKVYDETSYFYKGNTCKGRPQVQRFERVCDPSLRDPMIDYGIKNVRMETTGEIIDQRYACCDQRVGTPGCWIGTATEMFTREPVPYDFAPDFRELEQDDIWKIPGDMLGITFLNVRQGTAFKDIDYYNELHEQIIRLKNTIYNPLVRYIVDARDDRRSALPGDVLETLKKIYLLQDEYNEIQCKKLIHNPWKMTDEDWQIFVKQDLLKIGDMREVEDGKKPEEGVEAEEDVEDVEEPEEVEPEEEVEEPKEPEEEVEDIVRKFKPLEITDSSQLVDTVGSYIRYIQSEFLGRTGADETNKLGYYVEQLEECLIDQFGDEQTYNRLYQKIRTLDYTRYPVLNIFKKIFPQSPGGSKLPWVEFVKQFNLVLDIDNENEFYDRIKYICDIIDGRFKKYREAYNRYTTVDGKKRIKLIETWGQHTPIIQGVEMGKFPDIITQPYEIANMYPLNNEEFANIVKKVFGGLDDFRPLVRAWQELYNVLDYFIALYKDEDPVILEDSDIENIINVAVKYNTTYRESMNVFNNLKQELAQEFEDLLGENKYSDILRDDTKLTFEKESLLTIEDYKLRLEAIKSNKNRVDKLLEEIYKFNRNSGTDVRILVGKIAMLDIEDLNESAFESIVKEFEDLKLEQASTVKEAEESEEESEEEEEKQRQDRISRLDKLKQDIAAANISEVAKERLKIRVGRLNVDAGAFEQLLLDIRKELTETTSRSSASKGKEEEEIPYEEPPQTTDLITEDEYRRAFSFYDASDDNLDELYIETDSNDIENVAEFREFLNNLKNRNIPQFKYFYDILGITNDELSSEFQRNPIDASKVSEAQIEILKCWRLFAQYISTFNSLYPDNMIPRSELEQELKTCRLSKFTIRNRLIECYNMVKRTSVGNDFEQFITTYNTKCVDNLQLAINLNVELRERGIQQGFLYNAEGVAGYRLKQLRLKDDNPFNPQNDPKFYYVQSFDNVAFWNDFKRKFQIWLFTKPPLGTPAVWKDLTNAIGIFENFKDSIPNNPGVAQRLYVYLDKLVKLLSPAVLDFTQLDIIMTRLGITEDESTYKDIFENENAVQCWEKFIKYVLMFKTPYLQTDVTEPRDELLTDACNLTSGPKREPALGTPEIWTGLTIAIQYLKNFDIQTEPTIVNNLYTEMVPLLQSMSEAQLEFTRFKEILLRQGFSDEDESLIVQLAQQNNSIECWTNFMDYVMMFSQRYYPSEVAEKRDTLLTDKCNLVQNGVSGRISECLQRIQRMRNDPKFSVKMFVEIYNDRCTSDIEELLQYSPEFLKRGKELELVSPDGEVWELWYDGFVDSEENIIEVRSSFEFAEYWDAFEKVYGAWLDDTLTQNDRYALDQELVNALLKLSPKQQQVIDLIEQIKDKVPPRLKTDTLTNINTEVAFNWTNEQCDNYLERLQEYYRITTVNGKMLNLKKRVKRTKNKEFFQYYEDRGVFDDIDIYLKESKEVEDLLNIFENGFQIQSLKELANALTLTAEELEQEDLSNPIRSKFIADTAYQYILENTDKFAGVEDYLQETGFYEGLYSDLSTYDFVVIMYDYIVLAIETVTDEEFRLRLRSEIVEILAKYQVPEVYIRALDYLENQNFDPNDKNVMKNARLLLAILQKIRTFNIFPEKFAFVDRLLEVANGQRLLEKVEKDQFEIGLLYVLFQVITLQIPISEKLLDPLQAWVLLQKQKDKEEEEVEEEDNLFLQCLNTIVDIHENLPGGITNTYFFNNYLKQIDECVDIVFTKVSENPVLQNLSNELKLEIAGFLEKQEETGNLTLVQWPRRPTVDNKSTIVPEPSNGYDRNLVNGGTSIRKFLGYLIVYIVYIANEPTRKKAKELLLKIFVDQKYDEIDKWIENLKDSNEFISTRIQMDTILTAPTSRVTLEYELAPTYTLQDIQSRLDTIDSSPIHHQGVNIYNYDFIKETLIDPLQKAIIKTIVMPSVRVKLTSLTRKYPIECTTYEEETEVYKKHAQASEILQYVNAGMQVPDNLLN